MMTRRDGFAIVFIGVGKFYVDEVHLDRAEAQRRLAEIREKNRNLAGVDIEMMKTKVYLDKEV